MALRSCIVKSHKRIHTRLYKCLYLEINTLPTTASANPLRKQAIRVNGAGTYPNERNRKDPERSLSSSQWLV